MNRINKQKLLKRRADLVIELGVVRRNKTMGGFELMMEVMEITSQMKSIDNILNSLED